MGEPQEAALAQVKYFCELLATNKEVDDSIRPLLKLSRVHRAIAENRLRSGQFAAAITDPGGQDQDPRTFLEQVHHRIDLGPGDRRCIAHSDP